MSEAIQTTHTPHAAMAPHRHREAYVALVLRGSYAEWLEASLESDAITPGKLRQHAGAVAGQAAVDRWFELLDSR